MSTLAPTSTFVVNHQLQQQHQPNNNHHAAAKVVNNNTVNKGHHQGNQQQQNDENRNTETLLPTDLEKILAEVARTGGCSWLTWLGNKNTTAKEPVRNIKRIKRKRDAHGIYIAVKNGIAPSATAATNNHKNSSQGSRSGSEFEDSTQYECDSEGTSTTSNSEDVGGEQQTMEKRQQLLTNATTGRNSTSKYTSLGHAFSDAIALVLDHSYRRNGGYKLSPAEVRKFQTGADAIFQQRRRRLLELVVTNNHTDELLVSQQQGSSHHHTNGTKNGTTQSQVNVRNGPPFTIQRLAEVLLSPVRYYRQTHKLCNCMEKLLLVTSSIHAFGGITGGQTSQSKREERETAALADERERHESEQRSRRLRRRLSPSAMGDGSIADVNVPKQQHAHHPHNSNNTHHHLFEDKTSDHGSIVSNDGAMSAEEVAAQAKASLRQKFDHGLAADPQQQQQLRVAIGGNIRSMTTSPPPPTLTGATSAGIAMSSHSTVASFVRHLTEAQQQQSSIGTDQDQLHPMARAPSPILFAGTGGGIESPALGGHPGNVHMLQMHHAASLPSAGVLDGGAPTMDIVIDPKQQGGVVGSHGSKESDLETEIDRSSASNSDVDSESDDFSLDDSASDRSDGSDTGSAVYEPFSAARVIALNRMQQQQRLQQSRMQMLGEFRPPADSEYQSSDSIDSTMAEDSGGSDSSSSDLAD